MQYKFSWNEATDLGFHTRIHIQLEIRVWTLTYTCRKKKYEKKQILFFFYSSIIQVKMMKVRRY